MLETKRRGSGGDRTLPDSLAGQSGHDKRSDAGFLETLECKQKLMSGVPEETWNRVMENELHEASEEMEVLTMERRKAKTKGRGSCRFEFRGWVLLM